MRPDQIITRVRKYEASIAGVVSRFRKAVNTLEIDNQDRPILRQHGIEVADLLRDTLGDEDYSELIIAELTSGSPSHASASNILSIVRAALTRLENNPALLSAAPVEEKMPVLRFHESEPDEVSDFYKPAEAARPFALRPHLSASKTRLLAWTKEMGSPFRHAAATQSGKLVGGIALAGTVVGLLHVIGIKLGSVAQALTPWVK